MSLYLVQLKAITDCIIRDSAGQLDEIVIESKGQGIGNQNSRMMSLPTNEIYHPFILHLSLIFISSHRHLCLNRKGINLDFKHKFLL